MRYALLAFILLGLININKAQTAFNLEGSWQSEAYINCKDKKGNEWKDTNCEAITLTFKGYYCFMRNVNKPGPGFPYYYAANYYYYPDLSINLGYPTLIDSLGNEPRLDNYPVSKIYYDMGSKSRIEVINDSCINIKVLKKFGKPDSLGKSIKYYESIRFNRIPKLTYPDYDSLQSLRQKYFNELRKNSILLVNENDPSDTLHLRTGGDFSIECDLDTIKYSPENKAVYVVDGIPRPYLKGDSLLLMLNGGTIHTKNASGEETWKTLASNPLSYKRKPDVIPVNRIHVINYSSPKDSFINGTTAGIAVLSAISGLFIAPLVSINYAKWDFNKQRYFNVAGTSLACFAISMCISISTTDKVFKLTGNDKRNKYRIIQ